MKGALPQKVTDAVKSTFARLPGISGGGSRKLKEPGTKVSELHQLIFAQRRWLYFRLADGVRLPDGALSGF